MKVLAGGNKKNLSSVIGLFLVFALIFNNLLFFPQKSYAAGNNFYSNKYGNAQIFSFSQLSSTEYKLEGNIDDESWKKVDWGPSGDRYVQFEPNYQNTSIGDYPVKVKLNLYEKDGSFVKTIQNSGSIMYLGPLGFIYFGDRSQNYFVSIEPKKHGDVVNHNVSIISYTNGSFLKNKNVDDLNSYPNRCSPYTNFSLTYAAGLNGTISGNANQVVGTGGSGTAVTAVPNPGYAFSHWSDGRTDNPRVDANVTENKTVTAYFEISYESIINMVKESIHIIYAPGDSEDSVTENLQLMDNGAAYGATVTWTSSNPNVITPTGAVMRPASGGDAYVTLTATISSGGLSETKVFPDIRVLMDANVDIRIDGVTPEKIYVDEDKKIYIAGKGFRAFADKSKLNVSVAKEGWTGAVPAENIKIYSDNLMALAVPAADGNCEGAYTVIIEHMDFGTIKKANAYEITADSRYKRPNVEEVVLTTENPDIERKQISIKGIFEEDIERKGLYTLNDTGQAVTFNSYLKFKGSSLTIDTRKGHGSLMGAGRFYVDTADSTGIVSTVTIYEGDFYLDPGSFRFKLSGGKQEVDMLGMKMPIRINEFYFSNDGFKVNGDIWVGLDIDKSTSVGDWFNLDDIGIGARGIGIKKVFQINKGIYIPPFEAAGLKAGVDTLTPEYSFAANAKISGITEYGFDMAFTVRKGKVNYVKFVLSGLEVDVPPIMMKFTSFGGGIENLSDRSSGPTTVVALSSMSDMLEMTYQGRDFLNIENMRLGLSQYHMDASGQAKIYGMVDVGDIAFVAVWNAAKHPGYAQNGFELKGETKSPLDIIGKTKVQVSAWGKKNIDAELKTIMPFKLPSFLEAVGGAKINEMTLRGNNEEVKATSTVLGIGVTAGYNFKSNKVIFEPHIDPPKPKEVATGLYNAAEKLSTSLYNAVKNPTGVVKDLLNKATNIINDAMKDPVGTFIKYGTPLGMTEKAFDIATSTALVCTKVTEMALSKVVGKDVAKAIVAPQKEVIETAKKVKDVAKKTFNNVKKKLFCEEYRDSVALEINEKGRMLFEFNGVVSDNIVVQAPDYDTRYRKDQEDPALRLVFDQNDPNWNALYIPEENKVYLVLDVNMTGEWAFIDWNWINAIPEDLRPDVYKYADVTAYEIPEHANMRYVVDNILENGKSTELDFPAPGRYMLEIAGNMADIKIHTPLGGAYPLEFAPYEDAWNAVWYEDLNKVYAIVEVASGETEGWKIAGDSVKIYEISGDNKQALQNLAKAPGKMTLHVENTGKILIQVLGKNTNPRLYRPDGSQYPLVFDEGNGGFNAVCAQDGSSVSVLVDADVAGEWYLLYDGDAQVITYNADQYADMQDLISGSMSAHVTSIKVDDEAQANGGSLLFKVEGATDVIAIISPAGINMKESVEKLAYEGDNVLYFIVDKPQKGAWQLVTGNNVKVSTYYINKNELGGLAEIVEGYKNAEEYDSYPVKIDHYASVVMEVKFADDQTVNVSEDIEVIKPNGESLELDFDETSPSWNAYFKEDDNRLFILHDVEETGTWQIIAPKAEYVEVNNSYGELMGNIKATVEAGTLYEEFLEFKAPQLVALELHGAEVENTVIEQVYYDRSQRRTDDDFKIVAPIQLTQDNAKQEGDALYVLLRVGEDDLDKKWRIKSSDPFELEYRIITENGETIDTIDKFLNPPGGFNTSVELTAGKKWLLEVTPYDSGVSLYDPSGNEYPLSIIPEDASGDGYNAYRNGDTLVISVPVDESNAGEWKISSSKMVDVTVREIEPIPEIEKFAFADQGGGRYSVEWKVANPEPDEQVSILLIDEAAKNSVDYFGTELATGLYSSGKAEVVMPEGLLPGKYYLVLKSENSGYGAQYLAHDSYINVTYPNVPPTPGKPELVSGANGEIKIKFADPNFDQVDHYVVMMQNEDGTLDKSGPMLEVTPAESQEQHAVLSGLAPEKTYRIVVLAVAKQGETYYTSVPSECLEVFLPTPVLPEIALTINVAADRSKTEKVHETPYQYFEYVKNGVTGVWKLEERTRTLTEKTTLINAASADVNIGIVGGESCDIEFYLDGILRESRENASSLNVALTDLSEGAHEIVVVAVTEDGTENTLEERLIVDITSPHIGILSPGKDGLVSGDSVDIVGEAEAGSILKINNEEVSIGEDGEFSHHVGGLSYNVTTPLDFELTDQAGNRTEKIMNIMAVENLYLDSSSAGLLSLTTDAGDLSFSPQVFDYTLSVAEAVYSISFTPETQLLTQKIETRLGEEVFEEIPSGSSKQFQLATGSNRIQFRVTSEDGSVVNTYTVIVNRGMADETYSIIYDGNGNNFGSAPIDSNSYKKNDTAIVSGKGSMQKTGYTFAGWNTIKDGTGIWFKEGDTISIGDSNVILYAQWESSGEAYAAAEPDSIRTGNYSRKEFILTIANDYFHKEVQNKDLSLGGVFDGLSVEVMNCTSTTITAAVYETVYGGFDKKGIGEIIISPEVLEKSRLPLIAEITVKGEHTVRFLDDKGNLLKEEDVVHGASATAPAAPEKEGYVFIEWDKAFEHVTSDLTVFPHYEIKAYNVVFNSLGGSEVPVQTVDYGSKASVPQNPSRSGYVFSGWYREQSLMTLFDFSTSITGNLTLYAKWIKKDNPTAEKESSNRKDNQEKTETHATVVINGQKQMTGKEIVRENGSRKEVEITVESLPLIQKIEEMIAAKPEPGQKDLGQSENNVEVPVSAKNASSVAAKLNGEIFDKLSENKFRLSIDTGEIRYIIPAEEINIVNAAKALQTEKERLNDVEIEIRINKIEEAEANEIAERAKLNNCEVIVKPVDFSVTVKTKTQGKEKEYEITRFKRYVQREILLPEGVSPDRITTGAVRNADGTFAHIPTQVLEREGRYYAKLNSLMNSTYVILWNPVEVKAVDSHWSKAAVNDMAARLIVKNPEDFAPDKPITRGEFAEYITKALGIYRTGVAGGQLFADVPENDELADAIAIASEFGIIKGYTDGRFRPQALIAREEAMVMFARAMDIVELQEKDSSRIRKYEDKEQVSAWAYDAVKKALGSSVFNGRSTDTIAPRGAFTCAEAATAVRNLLIEAGLINK
ncbi:MAG: InlB B-repeat-containing protein [Tepidanaerobacteraceae bacterium]|jgi:uncharacterized repeat protein (TIGR02543 family)|nr:InlB B-repeat-containing protein [Tepidanaerobacteraceae bacterium]